MAESAHWERVTAVFGELAELPVGSRTAALDELRAHDPALHAEVTSLLHFHDQAGDRFEHPRFLAPEAEPSLAGRRVGAYVLVREIGRGGMGAVWEAERADAQYTRRVAIKMLAMGRDTEAMRRRFWQERELLARLDHGNIAKLLDGGVTEEGQPWFAMELVEGVPITTWCSERRLGVRERVRLFLQVCAAVAAAHEHLVVHRDLKPGNILVATDGTAKLLDFGVATLTERDDDATDLTGIDGVPLTAAYASPEQLRGESVTTASDVYSLGVVLYELLTGARPFAGRTEDRLLRTAVPPSRAVTAPLAAASGLGSVQRVAQRLRGDLDAVVLMALRPEADRRYRSVQQLGDDLARVLDGRQVQARPDTLGYRVATLVRRNRVAAALAAVTLVTLVGATVVSVREAAAARAERDRALLETARTKQVTQFFQDVLSTPKPQQEGRDITVVEALDAVIPRIDSTFAAAPDLRAAIKNTLGSTLHDMGLYDRARPLLEDALRIQGALDRGTITRERADALYNLAGVENETGNSARAESLYVAALGMYATLTPTDSADVYRGLNNLATAVHAQGRLEEAAALYGQVAGWLAVHAPADPVPATVALVNQATALTELGRYEAAEPLFRRAVAVYDSLFGAESIRVGQVLQPLAGALLFQEKYAEAEAAARRAWAIDAAAMGETNPATVAALRLLVNILMDGGRCAEAVPLADRILAMRGTALPETDLSIGTALLYAGWCRAQLGEVALGERQLRQGLALRRQTFPASHWAVAQGESLLGDVLAGEGPRRRDEAERLLRSGYEGLRRELDPGHVRVRHARERLERLVGPVGEG
jgi:serine/threonine-protein kinase